MNIGRPRKFDEEETLSKVMDSFWKNGYEGTTFGQLVEDSGLSRSSLYNSFGGKEALFERAVMLYIEKQFSKVRDGFEDESSSAGMLKQFVSGIGSPYDPQNMDCLLRKTVLLNAGSLEAPKESHRIRDYLGDLWGSMTSAISNLNKKQMTQLTAEERSALLVAAFFGSAAISRNGGDKELLKAISDGAAKLIE